MLSEIYILIFFVKSRDKVRNKDEKGYSSWWILVSNSVGFICKKELKGTVQALKR